MQNLLIHQFLSNPPFMTMVQTTSRNESYSWGCSQDVDEKLSVNVCRIISTQVTSCLLSELQIN